MKAIGILFSILLLMSCSREITVEKAASGKARCGQILK
jgi:hypothetical protein